MSAFSVLTASVTTGPLWLSGVWQIGAPETAAALQRRVHLLHERPTGGNDLTGLPGFGRSDRVLSADSQGVMEALSKGVLWRDLTVSDHAADSPSNNRSRRGGGVR